jgi:outer membrane protein assembly factor BamE (lipoprotein component of BamABCDE complex)
MRGTLPICLLVLLAACQGAAEQAAAVRQGQDVNRLTVGTVQRQIRVGMTNSEVAEVLGSPNMVTTDESRREVWVYDRISTDSVASRSSGGIGILVLGVGGDASARSTTQRTLTVIVKFDAANRVRDFAYRSSSF